MYPIITWIGLLIATPDFALAGQGPTAQVAVVGLHVAGLEDAAAAAAAKDLAKLLDKDGSFEAVNHTEVGDRLRGREQLVIDQAFLGPGREKLEDARVLYERADFENALIEISTAVSLLEEGMAASRDGKDLIDALLLLGLAQFGIGELDGARAAFKKVVILAPNRELDTVNYAPKIVALFDEVREQVRVLPAAQVSIKSSDDAMIYIDGREIGAAPQITDVPPGEHFVLVIASSGEKMFERITLSPGEQRDHLVYSQGKALVPTGQTVRARSEQSKQLYTALGAYVNTDLVVLGGEVGRGKVALQLYEPRTGNYSKGVAADAGGDPVAATLSLVPALSNYISEAATIRSDRVSHKVAPLDLAENSLLLDILMTPEYTDANGGTVTIQQQVPWYAWAGVAAVAAGGAAGLAVLLSDDDSGGGTDDGTPDDEEEIDPNEGVIIIGPFP